MTFITVYRNPSDRTEEPAVWLPEKRTLAEEFSPVYTKDTSNSDTDKEVPVAGMRCNGTDILLQVGKASIDLPAKDLKTQKVKWS
jgi:hypothetical protein